MGDAAGELADGLHLLALPQLLLGLSQRLRLLLFGSDVAAVGINDVAFGRSRPGKPAVAALLVAVAVLERGRPSAPRLKLSSAAAVGATSWAN